MTPALIATGLFAICVLMLWASVSHPKRHRPNVTYVVTGAQYEGPLAFPTEFAKRVAEVYDRKPTNDASRALLHGSQSVGVSSPAGKGSEPGVNERLHGSSPVVSAKATQGFKCPLIIALLLTLASAAQAQQSAIGDGLVERIERKLDQHREALDRQAAEAKAWRDRWDIVDRHPDGGKLFDGHRIAAFVAWLGKGIEAIWLVLVGAYRITWGLIAAIIALCVARVIRELSDAFTVWKVGKA